MRKKWAMVKISHLLFWTVCLLTLFILMYKVAHAERELACRDFDIDIGKDLEYRFADRNDIAKMIAGQGTLAALIGKPMKEFEVSDIERNLEANPYVRNAEVFADLDGTMRIAIKQKRPVLRVFQQAGKGYYIDDEGKKMPLSDKYTARVLTVTGDIEPFGGTDSLKERITQEVYAVAQFIHSNSFWSKQIDGIHINQQKEMILLPKVGNHEILFGDGSQIENKFHRLWVFYRKAINTVGWETYKVINLKYTGQVVCEK